MLQVLVTDGLTSVMSDQEIVDIVSSAVNFSAVYLKSYKPVFKSLQVKKSSNPEASAKELVEVADQYGTEDNCTALVSMWHTRLSAFKIVG